jgi:hypothetical protein
VGSAAIESVCCSFVQSRNGHDNSSYPCRPVPGNVETQHSCRRRRLSPCTVMEVKDTSLSEISGESGIFCTVVALASAELSLIPAEFFRPSRKYILWLRPTRDVDIRGIRAIHGTVVESRKHRNP